MPTKKATTTTAPTAQDIQSQIDELSAKLQTIQSEAERTALDINQQIEALKPQCAELAEKEAHAAREQAATAAYHQCAGLVPIINQLREDYIKAIAEYCEQAQQGRGSFGSHSEEYRGEASFSTQARAIAGNRQQHTLPIAELDPDGGKCFLR